MKRDPHLKPQGLRFLQAVWLSLGMKSNPLSKFFVNADIPAKRKEIEEKMEKLDLPQPGATLEEWTAEIQKFGTGTCCL